MGFKKTLTLDEKKDALKKMKADVKAQQTQEKQNKNEHRKEEETLKKRIKISSKKAQKLEEQREKIEIELTQILEEMQGDEQKLKDLVKAANKKKSTPTKQTTLSQSMLVKRTLS